MIIQPNKLFKICIIFSCFFIIQQIDAAFYSKTFCEKTESSLFRSDDFIIYFPSESDTLISVADRFLGDSFFAWRISEFNQITGIKAGKGICIPLKPVYPGGIKPEGLQNVPILAYHRFGKKAKGDIVVSEENFRQQLQLLKEKGFITINLSMFVDFLNMKQDIPEKSIIITIDDGYKSVYEIAFPILQEFGFKAELFIYTDFIGQSPNALTWTQLATMQENGFSVESHSKSHSSLVTKYENETSVDYQKRIYNELADSKKILETKLKSDIKFIAYPYGSFNDEIIELSKKAGYIGGVLAYPGTNTIFNSPFHLNRFIISSEDDLTKFSTYLETLESYANDYKL
ncbi:MAG: hypothetical protein A2161_05860 [Candidatus Schekmanbacteria bacterium RBG_13_48_7]|uniref:NodB homology domain-containing protein n=1 Tax=Candidatus Schekmanbacteria bacterium RBG_13_48_7 TaxID=1817878 RepID=A0A1F7RT44_9BACT|nr:MAG: hypothetical protein A2161_05860 [Candidatus Schekmanbacteria bacterium RBG_13_48_7]